MAKCVGVCTSNFIDFAANVYESSEKALYPASNVNDLNRRKKVWRTNGYFNIVAGSNTITFRETIAVDLVATLTAQEYFSISDFMAEIKVALEAAGASTYTVTQLSNGKIQIASNGAGGGGVFQIIWTSSVPMAEIIGFDSGSNSTGALTYAADVVRLHTGEWLKWDLGFPSTVQAFIIVGDRNEGVNISPSATIKIQGNTTDAWSTPAIDLTVPYADFALARWDYDGLGTYRYWRFSFLDKENINTYIEFGAVYLGGFHDATRGCVVFPLGEQYDDRSVVVFSESGQSYSQKLPKSMRYRMEWNGLTKDEKESLENHWESVGLTESFFSIVDSQDAFSVTNENTAKLFKFASPPQVELVSPNNFSMNWELREEL